MRGGITLQQEHKTMLESNAWLSDDVISATQRLLKEQHPAVGGLQDTSLGITFAMEPQEGEFVQVINVSGNH